MPRRLTTMVFSALLALPVQAADYSDPTWPCVQRKVETLSAGLMWAFPFEPDAVSEDADLASDRRVLAEQLALRRVEVDDLRGEVETFAARHGGDPQILGAVFMDVFDALNTRRSRIIDGIADVSLGQIALSERIDAARAEMDRALAADAPDFDRIDALEEQLDWDQVIFSDRQTTIQYLCETPVILERRLFAIAQMLQQMVQEPG